MCNARLPPLGEVVAISGQFIASLSVLYPSSFLPFSFFLSFGLLLFDQIIKIEDTFSKLLLYLSSKFFFVSVLGSCFRMVLQWFSCFDNHVCYTLSHLVSFSFRKHSQLYYAVSTEKELFSYSLWSMVMPLLLQINVHDNASIVMIVRIPLIWSLRTS